MHRAYTRTRNNRGYTLIEVMVSLMVFATLTLIFAATIPLAKKSSAMNGQYAQAISICQHKMDQLRGHGYGVVSSYTELNDTGVIDDAPTTSPYSFKWVDIDSHQLEGEAGDTLLVKSATITVDTTSNPDHAYITVSLEWYRSSSESKTSKVTLSGTITNVE